MLTHPDGSLMLRSGLKFFDLLRFDRVIVVVTAAQDRDYGAGQVVSQLFEDLPHLSLVVLPEQTNGPLESVSDAIQMLDVRGPVVVKDADNCVEVPFDDLYSGQNFVVGHNLHQGDVRKPASKSYLISNNQDLVVDIVEKKIVSETICVGVYGFEAAESLVRSRLEIEASTSNHHDEIFISHAISKMLFTEQAVFKSTMADYFEDWGTAEEWEDMRRRHQTLFVDLDGVLLKNAGKYGHRNWSNSSLELKDNLVRLKSLVDAGAQLVITTSRPSSYRDQISELMASHGIRLHGVVTGLHHAPRTLINDFAPTNPYPSARAVSVPRDGDLSRYV